MKKVSKKNKRTANKGHKVKGHTDKGWNKKHGQRLFLLKAN